MSDFGTLLDFDDVIPSAGNNGVDGMHFRDTFDDFSAGARSSNSAQNNGADFDPFAGNGSSSLVDTDYDVEMATPVRERYGNLLADFGSGEDYVNGRDPDGLGNLVELEKSPSVPASSSTSAVVLSESLVFPIPKYGPPGVVADDQSSNHVDDDTYDILCAFPESTAPQAEIEDTTIGDEDDWPPSSAECTGDGRRKSFGFVTRFDLSATTIHVLTPTPSDDESEVDVTNHLGMCPIAFIDGDDDVSGTTVDVENSDVYGNGRGDRSEEAGGSTTVAKNELYDAVSPCSDGDVSIDGREDLGEDLGGCTVTTLWSGDDADLDSRFASGGLSSPMGDAMRSEEGDDDACVPESGDAVEVEIGDELNSSMLRVSDFDGFADVGDEVYDALRAHKTGESDGQCDDNSATEAGKLENSMNSRDYLVNVSDVEQSTSAENVGESRISSDETASSEVDTAHEEVDQLLTESELQVVPDVVSHEGHEELPLRNVEELQIDREMLASVEVEMLSNAELGLETDVEPDLSISESDADGERPHVLITSEEFMTNLDEENEKTHREFMTNPDEEHVKAHEEVTTNLDEEDEEAHREFMNNLDEEMHVLPMQVEVAPTICNEDSLIAIASVQVDNSLDSGLSTRSIVDPCQAEEDTDPRSGSPFRSSHEFLEQADRKTKADGVASGWNSSPRSENRETSSADSQTLRSDCEFERSSNVLADLDLEQTCGSTGESQAFSARNGDEDDDGDVHADDQDQGENDFYDDYRYDPSSRTHSTNNVVKSETVKSAAIREQASLAAVRRNLSRERRQQQLSSRNDEDACQQCGKRVYPMEMITADELVYHKSCFRCTHCNRVLSLLNYSAIDGHVFCKPHFLELFKLKGNYAASFNKAGTRLQENGDAHEHDAEQLASDRNSSLQRNESSDDDVLQKEVSEEIPTIPLKHVRNIFETLAQNSTQQQQASRPTRSRSVEKVAVSEESERPASRGRNYPDNNSIKSDSGEREVVQGSSTVFVIDEELPPPAITRSILAKFRELQSGNPVQQPHKPSEETAAFKKAAVPVKSTSMPAVAKLTENSGETRSQYRQHNGHVSELSGSENSLHHDDPRDNGKPSNLNDEFEQNGPTADADELPQQGITKNLLARWRSIEQQASRGRSDAKRSTPTRRTQSASRAEVRPRLMVHQDVSEDEDAGIRNGVADYRNSHSDVELDQEQPPALMTKRVLAKFRSMEDENRSVASQRPLVQRQRSFKWEVKEPVPFNRGYLSVHGDTATRRSLHEINVADMPSEGASNLEDELPAPSTTRNLLTLFQSMEDPTAPAPTPERAEKRLARGTSYRNSLSESELERFNDGEWNINAAARTANVERDHSPVRESDSRIDETEFPERGSTRGLLAKFQTMQQSK